MQPRKLYKCSVCRKTLSGCMKRHMLTHAGEKPHECDMCKKTFSRASNLNRHMYIQEENHMNATFVRNHSQGLLL